MKRLTSADTNLARLGYTAWLLQYGTDEQLTHWLEENDPNGDYREENGRLWSTLHLRAQVGRTILHEDSSVPFPTPTPLTTSDLPSEVDLQEQDTLGLQNYLDLPLREPHAFWGHETYPDRLLGLAKQAASIRRFIYRISGLLRGD